MRGADLMLPGVDVDGGLPDFQKGDLLAVCVRGNPLPVAVGLLRFVLLRGFWCNRGVGCFRL